MSEKIIYKDLSYQINGICFQVHNELGRFAREKQYADRLEKLLKEQEINYHREFHQPFQIDKNVIAGNIFDFLIEG